MIARPARRSLAAIAAGVLAGAMLVAQPADAAPTPQEQLAEFTTSVKPKNLFKHLEALQRIGDANGGNRASGLPGHRASVDYVAGKLREAGYQPVIQQFDFDYTEENSELQRVSPLPRTYDEGSEFIRNQFDTGTPEGEATGTLFPVDLRLDAPTLPANTSNSGCESGDFAGMPAGAVALLQRGTCGFAVKVLNAQAAGASAAVVMNEGQPGRTGLVGMIGDATGLRIPAVFATFAAGADLAGVPGSVVRVKVEFTAETRPTYNVIAETRTGDASNVVMAGAHLDSVQDGPGINDNGTGSAGLLEVAIQFAKTKPANMVRFAWWGAEESGLLGSEHYVAELSQAEVADIALYLNFDMIGSPNYMFGVYDGDNSSGTAAPGFIPPGSAEIEDVFEKFYADRGLTHNDTEFSGRSDYGAFIGVGIPAGGLFTGAEGVKSAAQAVAYGGVAGAAYDPCYHSFCDNLTGEGQNQALYDAFRLDYTLTGNVNNAAFDVNADAVATAVMTFAFDTSTLPARTAVTSAKVRLAAPQGNQTRQAA